MRTLVLRRPIVFLCVPCSICVRCRILILLIKAVRCRIVRFRILRCRIVRCRILHCRIVRYRIVHCRIVRCIIRSLYHSFVVAFVRCSIPDCTEARRYWVLFRNEGGSNFRRVSHERSTDFSKGTHPHASPLFKNHISTRRGAPLCAMVLPPSSHLGVLVSLLNRHLVTNRRQLVTLLFTIQQLKIKSVGPLLR